MNMSFDYKYNHNSIVSIEKQRESTRHDLTIKDSEHKDRASKVSQSDLFPSVMSQSSEEDNKSHNLNQDKIISQKNPTLDTSKSVKITKTIENQAEKSLSQSKDKLAQTQQKQKAKQEEIARFQELIALAKNTTTSNQSSATTKSREENLKSFKFTIIILNKAGKVIKKDKSSAFYYRELLSEKVSLDLVKIPGGQFMKGSPKGEGYEDEKPQQEVNIQPFFIGKYLVTQAQWQLIASLPRVKLDLAPEPSAFKGDALPVEQISWNEAVEFCERLSRQKGREYRLPSEAEWEYACRAGTTTAFHFGETIRGELANYRASETYADEPSGEYRQTTTTVGSFPPNAFGLYDMHGNLWEWCENDWQSRYDGAYLSTGSRRKVVRGGSWYLHPRFCRSAFRNFNIPDARLNTIGFRVVCDTPKSL